jgi:outer membrane lipoprotein-sorting protein
MTPVVKFINTFLIILLTLSYSGFAQSVSTRDEIYKMLAACDNLKTSSFNLISTERLKDGTYHESEILVKLQRNPKNVYVYCVNPNPGAECLWRAGELNNLLLINPNGFPFFNLKLNTHNALLRKGQHHTIEEIGFDYITEVFRHYIRKEGDKIFDLFSLNGTAEYDGHHCKVLQYENPVFTYDNYIVQGKENLTNIGYANYVSDYMLLVVNELKSFNSVKPGQVLKLPATYGKKIVLYLDEYTELPIVQMIYDDKGLYEKYEFRSFVLNPKFGPDDFSPGNPKYGF